MGKREEFEHDSIQNSRSVSAYLKALADGFENGKIVFKSEDQEIVLLPDDLLELNIKARHKSAKNKISIKIGWKDAEEPAGATPDFRIST